MLGNCQIFHNHGHNTLKQGGSLLTCLNPHIRIIQVITTIASCWIEVGSSSSRPNSKKYGEKMKKRLAD